jgi:O-antigen ligase
MLLVIAVCLYAALLWAMGARPRLRRAAAVLAVAVALTALAVAQTDWLQQRVVQLSGLFSDDYALVNTAVNNRLPHWEAAARMYQENPINGIGVKTYKFSYADYADGDTVFRGQPHLFVLEVAAETGTVGLLGFALFLALIAALLLRLVRQRHYDAVPWGIALLLAAFPLNATLALIWYLAIVFFAVAARETQAS